MRKVIKILGKVVSWIILTIVSLPILIVLLLNVGVIQNFVVQKASAFISKKLETTVSIDHIRLRGFSNVSVEGFYVEDYAGDTLFYAKAVGANISKSALLGKKIVIGEVSVDQAKVYLFSPKEGEMNLSQVLNKLSSDTTSQESSVKLLFRNIKITDTRFKLQSEGADTITKGVNYSNMVLSRVNIKSKELEINGSTITMDIGRMSFRDISGFEAKNVSASRFHLADGLIAMDDTRIVTEDSDLHIPAFKMQGATWASMSYAVDSVRFDVTVTKSDLSTHTLAYFVPTLGGKETLSMSGIEATFGGTINNFAAQVIAQVADESTQIEATAKIVGVTDFQHSKFDIDIKKLITNAKGVKEITGNYFSAPLPANITEILNRAGNLSLTAKANGEMSRFRADIDLDTNGGEVTFVGMGGLLPGGDIDFDGHATVNGVEAGKLLDNKLLGKVTVDAKAKGSVRKGELSISGMVFVPMAEFNGYTYSQIMASGEYAESKVTANVTSGDPKLQFTVNGSADFKPVVPDYDLTLNLRTADLYRLNINPKDSVSLISGKFSVKGSGSKLDNINGQAVIANLTYTSSIDYVKADTIALTGRNNEESKYMAMHSSYADIEYQSDISYNEIFSYLNHILYDYLPALDPSGTAMNSHTAVIPVYPDNITRAGKLLHAPLMTAEEEVPEVVSSSHLAPRPKSRSELHVNIKKANNIAAIFLPGFSIAEGTKADVAFNPETELFSITANSDYIEYATFFVTKLGFVANNAADKEEVVMQFTTEDLYLPKFTMPSNNISAHIKDNNIDISARLSNSDTDLNALIDVESTLSRTVGDNKLLIGLKFDPTSYIMTGQKRWNISSNQIEYDPARISIDNFLVTGDGQRMHIDGVLSSERSDTLRLSLDRLSLDPIGRILKMEGVNIGGTLDGSAELISGSKDPVLIADIVIDSLSVNNYTAAPLRLSSSWDFASERAQVVLKNMQTDKNLIAGFYFPKTSRYLANVDIDNLTLSALGALLPPDIIKSIDGTGAVYLDVSGKGAELPQIHGTVSVEHLAATIGITNVTYKADVLDIDIDNNIISIPKTILTDNESNKVTLEAQADIKNLSNITYEAKLLPTNILAINTTLKENEQFYGKVYLSGAINVKGNKSGVNIDVAATTQNNSSFYLPLSGKSNISEADWIQFVSREPELITPEDILQYKKQQYEKSLKEVTKSGSEKMNVNLNVSLNITPGLLLSIIIDPATNMTLNTRGSAVLDVLLNPGTGELSTFGTYQITEGDFLFSIPPIISNKKFILQPGGTIQLSGNPMAAMLNVEAIYKLRASLQPLAESFQGTGINTSARIPVDCIISIKESLQKPDISFDIKIPSADADIQSVLNGIMSSNEGPAMNFIFLVSFGSFAPTGTGTETTAATAGTNLGIDFLANQLSSWASGKDFSVTFRYRPSSQDQTTSDEFDFGFSYNLGGNNRLILEVEGNYDMGDNKLQNVSNMSGDASITWVLTKSGNLRLKGFTRTINRYDENQGLQENGVGVYYREDFNVFSDILVHSRERQAARKKRRTEKAATKSQQVVPTPTPVQVETPMTMPQENSAPAPETNTAPVDNPASEIDTQAAKSRIEQRRAESEEQRRRLREERMRSAATTPTNEENLRTESAKQ